MKTISPQLEAHVQGEVTTLCTCWKARLTNGAVFGFTNHTEDRTFESVEYLASTGYTPTAISTSGKLDVDNLDIEGLLDSSSITEADIFAGLWDYAEIEIFKINYADLTQGALGLRKGWLGQISTTRNAFTAELRGLTQKLQQSIGELYSPSCRATLGDSRCGVNLAAFTFAGSIQTLVSQRQFADASLVNANGYFDYGLITFTSGLNANLSMEVKTYTVGSVILQLPMPYALAEGDSYNIIAGCGKLFVEDCQSKFNNVINFRGEPHVPGLDKTIKGPD